MPRPAAKTRAVSEQRILAAARARFESYGYHRTNVAEIARDAGIAVGTIYRYFESKEEIFLRVVRDMNESWLIEARRVLSGPGAPHERLARLGAASVEFNRENGLLTSIINRDSEMVLAPVMDPLGEDLLKQNVALMTEVICEGIEDGSMRPVDPERAAFVLFVVGQALFQEKHRPYADVLPVMLDIVMNGLLRR